MSNVRNSRTTHPRKAKRRATALANFTVARVHMWNEAYMAKRLREFLALGGTQEQFAFVPQRLSA